MNSLLNLVVAVSLETLGFGAQVVIIGMATIFAVLTVLMFALKLFEMIFTESGKKEKEADSSAAEAALPVAAVDNTEEIVAVIAAAIAAAEAESPALKFRVVSFKRK